MDENPKQQRTKTLFWVGGIALIVAAAVFLASANQPSIETDPAAAELDVLDPEAVYDPFQAGEPLPDGYRQLLRRDMIHPIYEPVFVGAESVDWPYNTDVIGVAGDEEAKAYPVSHLNFREMVIDDIEGIPILVSW